MALGTSHCGLKLFAASGERCLHVRKIAFRRSRVDRDAFNHERRSRHLRCRTNQHGLEPISQLGSELHVAVQFALGINVNQ
jgi:hypothetical protein